MKKIFGLAILALGGFILSGACGRMSKGAYMRTFSEFIVAAEKEYETWTPEDAKRVRREFDKYAGPLLQHFLPELSSDERVSVQQTKLRFELLWAKYQARQAVKAVSDKVSGAIDEVRGFGSRAGEFGKALMQEARRILKKEEDD